MERVEALSAGPRARAADRIRFEARRRALCRTVLAVRSRRRSPPDSGYGSDPPRSAMRRPSGGPRRWFAAGATVLFI